MSEFFLDIIPPRTTAQQKKVSCWGGRPKYYEPKNVKDAKKILIDALLPFMPAEPAYGAVSLFVDWRFPAKSHKEGWKTTAPDTDNLDKMLKDVMTQLGFWDDDALVVDEHIQKHWSKQPGILIRVEELK